MIVFRKLDRKDLLSIVSIETQKVKDRMADKGLKLILDDEVLEFLIQKGYEPEYGARPLRRAVERMLEDPLAENILKGYFVGATAVRAKLDNQKLLFFPEYEDSAPAPADKPVSKKKTGKDKKSGGNA